jgi:ribosome-associated toxin RatA of RatAB toxin-antitoxin module
MWQETNPNQTPYDLDLQQRINHALLDLTAPLTIGVQAGAKRKHLLFLALSYKCFATARSIGSLCDQGFCDDALALLRVIVEGVINAVYILNSDDQVAEDYMDYPKFQAWCQLEQIRAVAPQLADYVSQEQQAEMQAQFQQVSSRYASNRTKEWTKDNIFERAKFIDANSQLFQALMNVTWKDAAAYVHSTARSIEWRIDAGGVKSSRVATKEEIATIIYYSNMALFALFPFLDALAGKKGFERWKDLCNEWNGSTPAARSE